MDTHLLNKYSRNIDVFVNAVSIYPKDFRKKDTLNKRWKVYINYSVNGKRQSPINKSSYILNGQTIWVNKIKDHKNKITHILHIRDKMIYDLRNDPRIVTIMLHGYDNALNLYPSIFNGSGSLEYNSIKSCFDYALDYKKSKISQSFYSDLLSVSNRFLKFIGDDADNDVKTLNKKVFLDFLDSIGKSNKTYNNAKANLSTLLSCMTDAEYISKNFLLSVSNLKTKPTSNKAFSPKQVTEILLYLKVNDPILLGYCMHVYYGLMRPITVNRLRVKDVDLVNRTFNTRTKTFDYIKIITETLYNDFYKDLNLNTQQDKFIFGYKSLLDNWDATEKNRQGYYGKRFRKVKDKFNLGSDYSIYSFRHSAIAKIFETKYYELKEKGISNYKRDAVKFVMPFLNHTNENTTLKYLRNVSTLVHVDWSDYLE